MAAAPEPGEPKERKVTRRSAGRAPRVGGKDGLRGAPRPGARATGFSATHGLET